ncbi:hypothetical protein E2C01_096546 [Portunus trituberculatus]|uniref:Uncharacterized protein n=1 Tax=Portunus trituberculatus TaxID=210409 RepID=A0A5B7K8I5_PORTR|nr:hypothetical protein [Portunus trituberculatus]
MVASRLSWKAVPDVRKWRAAAGWQLGFILPCAGRRALGQTSSQHKLTSEGVESDCEITLGVTALLAEEYFQSRWGFVTGAEPGVIRTND